MSVSKCYLISSFKSSAVVSKGTLRFSNNVLSGNLMLIYAILISWSENINLLIIIVLIDKYCIEQDY